MAATEPLATWDRDHYWHAFTQMAEYIPLVIDRADGVWLYDSEGRRYLDGISSMWCNLFGHRNHQIDSAIRKQLDKVAHATSLGLATPPAIELAKRLAELAPGDLNHVFFGSDGSSAVEAAIKIAFQYWRQCDRPQPQKTKYIALGEAYHGDTIGSASVGGIDRFNAAFYPLLFEVIRVSTPNRYVGGVEVAPDDYLAELEQVLREHHETVAAMVIEPCLQAAAGMVFHPVGYLRGVRELTRQYNVLLIADEIVTGCGRTGWMFACESEGVVPDILCLGKSLTGGYLPLSAAIAASPIYRTFLGTAASARSFRHGHTYAGNPLGATAAVTTLELISNSKAKQELSAKIAWLSAKLADLGQRPHVAATRQLGMIAAVELTPSRDLNERYAADIRIAYQICRAALARGLWLRPLGDTLVIMPPLSITNEELHFYFDALTGAIQEVTSNPLPPDKVQSIAGDD